MISWQLLHVYTQLLCVYIYIYIYGNLAGQNWLHLLSLAAVFYRLQPTCELGLQFLVRSRLVSFCASEVQNIFRTCRFHIKCLKAGPGVQENRRNEPLEAKSHRWPTRGTKISKNDKTQTLVPHLPRANKENIENPVPCILPCNLDAPIDFTLLGPRPKFWTSLGQLRQCERTPTVRVLAGYLEDYRPLEDMHSLCETDSCGSSK
jgi:hypothetical protein